METSEPLTRQDITALREASRVQFSHFRDQGYIKAFAPAKGSKSARARLLWNTLTEGEPVREVPVASTVSDYPAWNDNRLTTGNRDSTGVWISNGESPGPLVTALRFLKVGDRLHLAWQGHDAYMMDSNGAKLYHDSFTLRVGRGDVVYEFLLSMKVAPPLKRMVRIDG